LLGLAWCGLKAQQWVDCIASAQQLSRTTKKVPLQCEAGLLEAYANMVQKKYADAVTILVSAQEKLAAYPGPSETEKSAHGDAYQKNRQEYGGVAEKARDLAITVQTSNVLSQIDSLHTPQVNYKNKIDDHLRYIDEFTRSTFFSQDVQKVKEDIEYALAKAQKMAGARDVEKVHEKTIEKGQEIDEEMQKLQQELQQLENKDGGQ
jgi:hypothetical protein